MKRFLVMIHLFFFVFIFHATCTVAQTEETVAVSEEKEQVYQSQENDPRAVIKEGLYVGIEKGRVAILEGSKSREKSYRLIEDYHVLYNEQEIDWNAFGYKRIPPHSVVKLVMIDGQIVEIILLEVSS